MMADIMPKMLTHTMLFCLAFNFKFADFNSEQRFCSAFRSFPIFSIIPSLKRNKLLKLVTRSISEFVFAM